MSNFGKKVRDNQDKEILRQKFGKNPKHRCPDCHRFTFWISDEKTKSQCIWCKIKNEKGENNDSKITNR